MACVIASRYQIQLGVPDLDTDGNRHYLHRRLRRETEVFSDLIGSRPEHGDEGARCAGS
jgi:hypothetical protein